MITKVADGDASAICDHGDTVKADLAGDFKGRRQDSPAGLARFRVGPPRLLAIGAGATREAADLAVWRFRGCSGPEFRISIQNGQP